MVHLVVDALWQLLVVLRQIVWRLSAACVVDVLAPVLVATTGVALLIKAAVAGILVRSAGRVVDAAAAKPASMARVWLIVVTALVLIVPFQGLWIAIAALPAFAMTVTLAQRPTYAITAVILMSVVGASTWGEFVLSQELKFY